MKKIKYIFTFALLALLFAACSEDDIIQAPQTPSTGETERTETVTFTATVDYSIEGDGSRTRAISASEDEPPTRFCAQALYKVNDAYTRSEVVKGEPNVDGSIKFTFEALTPNQDYTFLFWADNVNTAQLPDDLRSIPYSAGDIAFAVKAEGTPEDVDTDVDMKHVVSKVTLQHSGDNNFQPKAGDALIVTLNSATTYNVLDEEATGTATQTVTQNYSSATSIAGGTDICHFYALAPSSSETVALKFRDFNLDINNVPLSANTRVTLQGDLSSNNDKWTVPEANRKETFGSCFFNDNGNPNGELSVGNTYVFYSDLSTVRNFCETILNRSFSVGYSNFTLWEYQITFILMDISSETGILSMNIDGTQFSIRFGTNYVGDHDKTFELPSSVNKDW